MSRGYQDLVAWQKSMDLVAERLKYVAPEHEKPITSPIHEVSRIISRFINNSLQERE